MQPVQLCNQHRVETHRALELLSDCYSKLTKSQEKSLIIEIERLIRVLKSKFFQALIDIQEFYEITLLDGIKPSNLLTISSVNSFNTWKSSKDDYFHSSIPSIHDTNDRTDTPVDDKWECIETTITRGETGLGFSIAGGVDNPHYINDFGIYVTKIIPNGAAAQNGQLKILDMIQQVNDVSLVNVTHAVAVDTLKQAGDKVKLSIRRKNYAKNIQEIELKRGKEGFGFSIAGGVGNQHIPGQNGIYITKIMDKGVAQLDGRLKVGHKLIGIKNESGYRDLENVTHDEAVEALKNTQEKITLYTLPPEDNKSQSNINLKKVSMAENSSTTCPDTDQSITKSVKDDTDFPSICTTEPNLLPDTEQTSSSDNQVETVTLERGPSGFGFNIVGGEDGEGIFISFILEGGPAYLNGKLRKGDEIKSVNGIDFSSVTHEEAASVLKGVQGAVTLTVERNVQGYNRFESKLNSLRKSQQSLHLGSLLKTTQKKSMYVRALFNYDPNKDDDLPSLGLQFRFGNILHVTNASDDEWWLATKIVPENNEGFGIIPARKRWERKQRARERSVKFEGHMPVVLDKQSLMDKRKKNYSFSRRFPFMKNKDDKSDDYNEQEGFMLCYTQDDTKLEDTGSKEILYRVELPYMEELTLVYLEKDADEEDTQQLCGEEIILSYDEVKKVTINYTRPIVILGPMKDRVNDDLISEFPEKFGSCVPHTSRPKREKEIDGQDYHFVSSREEMERDIQNHLFIEAGQYNDNLYGTSIASVKGVAEKGKHCILDVSGNAIKRLYAAGLYPIALFIKVKSPDSIIGMHSKITDEQARKMYYRALRIEQEFTEYFTGIIEADVYQDIYEQIKECISQQSGPHIWISCKLQHS